ncbi:MAG: porin [Pseudomonadota bacterium]
MNKKLLAVAIASAIAAPLAAQADDGNVTLYGTASVAVEAIDVSNTTASGVADFDATQVNNNHSALGVKGWESLGNGLKAVFLMDMFVGLDSGNSSGATNGSLLGGGRDGYVGLAGNFGTVALGFHGRPWKTSTNNIDLFGSTIADYSAIMGTYNPGGAYFDGGIGNAAIWFLPNMNGFSGHLQWGADEADNDSNSWGAQANYSNGPFYGSISYDEDGRSSTSTAGTGGDVKDWKLAASYTFAGATTVTAMYENLDVDALGTFTERDRDAWYLGVAHKIGNNTLKLAYANADNSNAGDDGADYWAVGADHAFSKRTTVYALYSRLENDTAGTYRFQSQPHTSNFSTGSATVAAGAEMDVISVGIKHNF